MLRVLRPVVKGHGFSHMKGNPAQSIDHGIHFLRTFFARQFVEYDCPRLSVCGCRNHMAGFLGSFHEIGFPMTHSGTDLGFLRSLTNGYFSQDDCSFCTTNPSVKPPFPFLVTPSEKLPVPLSFEGVLIQGSVDRFVTDGDLRSGMSESSRDLLRTPVLPEFLDDVGTKKRIVEFSFVPVVSALHRLRVGYDG